MAFDWLAFFLNFEVLAQSCPRILSSLTMNTLFPVWLVANSLKTRHRSSCYCKPMFWLERESSWSDTYWSYRMNDCFHMGTLPNLKLRLALFSYIYFLCMGWNRNLFTLLIICDEVLNTVLNIIFSIKFIHYETISLKDFQKFH